MTSGSPFGSRRTFKIEKGTLRTAENPCLTCIEACGAKRARTADLLHAMQALYQLSYSPGIAHVTGTRTGVSIPVPWTLSNNLDTDPRTGPNRPPPPACPQRSSLSTGSGSVPALCSTSRQCPCRRDTTDQAQLASGPMTPQRSSGRPSSRAAPSLIAAP